MISLTVSIGKSTPGVVSALPLKLNSTFAKEVEAKPEVQYHSNATQTDSSPSIATSTLPAPFRKLSFAERKVALNLTQFAQSQADGVLDPDKITNLIETLTAEAPQSVEKLVSDSEKVACGNTEGPRKINGPLSDGEAKDLQALITLAQRRLQSRM